MPTIAEFETAFAAVDAETTRIANYILELLAMQKVEGLTEEEEMAIFDKLAAAADRLKGVGASVEEPVPPVVEEPV